jgi:hypothetical protein
LLTGSTVSTSKVLKPTTRCPSDLDEVMIAAQSPEIAISIPSQTAFSLRVNTSTPYLKECSVFSQTRTPSLEYGD